MPVLGAWFTLGFMPWVGLGEVPGVPVEGGDGLVDGTLDGFVELCAWADAAKPPPTSATRAIALTARCIGYLHL
jgi:hypothetical protein